MKKTYLVVGLGRFGSAVAQRLYELGSEVMAVDLHPELVQKRESKVTCAAVCDARDEDALRALGAHNYDCAVVAIGGDLATSVVATLNLKELGVQTVVCKATDETQRRALEKIGADRVVVPERESGIKLAQSLTSSSILDFIELSPDCGIAELQTPQYRQAMEVMHLNEYRWEIERNFRDYAWVQYDFFQNKGLLDANDAHAVRVLDAEKGKNIWLQIHRENYAKLMLPHVREARALQMELLVETIYEINKPQTRKVVLRPN